MNKNNAYTITKEEQDLILETFNTKFDGWGIYDIYFFEAEEGVSDVDGVLIDVEGDWKHAHLYCDYLMDELGYVCEYNKITDESGSDWYSATHGYVKDIS